MHLFSLGGSELIEKILVHIEVHTLIFQLMNVGKWFLSEIFSEGEGMYGLDEFLICEEEDKTTQIE